MDIQSALLNRKWKNYFNWTVIYPFLLLFGIMALAIIVVLLSFSTLLTNDLNTMIAVPFIALVMAMMGTVTLLFILCTVGVFVYLIWFIVASDYLFKLLNVNRTVGNILNLIGIFVIPGLSLLILPIYFWIKVRDYWSDRNINSSWRAVV